jgi:hemoglobin/transferrin/lactoferrin receptor protein
MLSISLPAAENRNEDVVVTSATCSNSDVKRSSRTIGVISRQTLEERSGLTGIQPLLAEIPGIQFVRSGELGGQIMMPDFNSNEGRMVLAIDGDRYEGRNTLQFNMLDPDAIERIEVIRGPASALYGSDAMTGVINIVTRRAQIDASAPFTLSPHLCSMEWNSVNNMYGGRTELSGGGNGFDLMLGASYRHADDYDTPIGTARNSDSQSKAIDFNAGFRRDARLAESGCASLRKTGIKKGSRSLCSPLTRRYGVMSGSSSALLRHRPLRTVRASFPAYGSSL